SALFLCFFFQAEDGIRDPLVTGVQTCALPISPVARRRLAILSFISAARVSVISSSNSSAQWAVGGAAPAFPMGLRSLRNAAGMRSEERRVGKEWRSRRRMKQ